MSFLFPVLIRNKGIVCGKITGPNGLRALDLS